MKQGTFYFKALSILLALMVPLTGILGGCGSPQTSEKAVSQAVEAQKVASSETSEQLPQITRTPLQGAKKTETVYVNLDAGGKPLKKTVTDWLHSDVPGVCFPDMSDLSGIVNIKGEQQPIQDGSGLIWQMDGTDLYYSGESDKALPLEIHITYRLDGRELSPEQLAGKSGKLEMHIRFENRSKHTVTIAGKETQMYTPITAMAAMSLSEDTFRNVEVSDGTVVSDGNNQAVALVCLPGLQESFALGSYSVKEINDLDFPEEFTITADVTEFEMGPVMIAASPALPDLEDLKKSEEFNDMKQDLYDMRDVQEDFEDADPDRDMRSLFTDSARTEGAQLLVDDIFDFYDLNTDILDILPNYVTKENLRLYDRIRFDLKDSTIDTLLDEEDLSDLLDYVDDLEPAKLDELVKNYEDIHKDKEMTAILRSAKPLLMKSAAMELLQEGISAAAYLSAHQEQAETLEKLASCGTEFLTLAAHLNQANASMSVETLRRMAVTNVRSLLLPGANGAIDAATAQQLKALGGQIPGMDMNEWEAVVATLTKPDQTDGASVAQVLEARERMAQASDEKPSHVPVETGTAENLPEEDLKNTDGREDGLSTGAPADGGKPDAAAPKYQDSGLPAVGASGTDMVLDSGYFQLDAETVQRLNRVSQRVADADDKNRSRTHVLNTLTGAIGQMSEAQLKQLLIAQGGDMGPLFTVMEDAKVLQEKMAQAGLTDSVKLQEALVFAMSEETGAVIASLLTAKNDCEPELGRFMTDVEENPEAVAKFHAMLPELLSNADLNKNNFETLQLLLKKLHETDMLDQVENIDDLRQDLIDVRPIIKALRRDLDRRDMRVSLHESPETTAVLLKMRDDLEEWRDISETLRTAVRDDNVEITRNIIATLDRLQAKDASGNAIEKIEDIDELLERKDAYVNLSEQYGIFTAAAQGVETEVKFVMKTDEIKKPEPQETAAPPVQKETFFTWLEGLIPKKEIK